LHRYYKAVDIAQIFDFFFVVGMIPPWVAHFLLNPLQLPLEFNIPHSIDLANPYGFDVAKTTGETDSQSNSTIVSVTLIPANHCPGAAMYVMSPYFLKLI